MAVPAEFDAFFVASAGASATLIGLLFVAVSVRPERVFGGGEASAEHFSTATGAFTAFLNVFFVSLGALLPLVDPGVFVLVMGTFAVLNTLGLARTSWRRWRRGRGASREVGLVLIGLLIYGLQLRYGWALLRAPTGATHAWSLSSLTIVLLAAYGVGLGRAWELLGARRWGLLAWFFSAEVEERSSSGPARKPDDRAP